MSISDYYAHGFTHFIGTPWLLLVIIWEYIWKGLAAYRAAQGKQKIWFVVLLVINSFGILPILYLIFFSKKHHSSGHK